MSSAHETRGRTVTSVPAASQSREIDEAGVTLMADATVAGSIGRLNEIATPAPGATSVRSEGPKAAEATGAGDDGGVAEVRAGASAPMAAMPMIPPIPIAMPILAATERRSRTGR